MTPSSFSELRDGAEFDFVIVGSGFGGSVSALRLVEKGYSVAVLEAGRHYRDRDFARTNWRLDKWLWFPKLFLYGIQRMTWFSRLLVLSGAGVGGGSLVYANTLLEPGDAFYDSEEVRRLGLREKLKAHFATAKRMLGAAQNPRLSREDAALREVAVELAREATFSSSRVGVFFGEPGKTVPDPYFGGEGPERAGCTFCGACMVGCRHNAKNTLLKNYLHFALKKGARVFALSTVTRIAERAEGGFDLGVRRSGWGLGEKRVHARRLVLSAGVLGTMRLLLEPRNALSRLPARLGHGVLTNSEVIVGAVAARAGAADRSEGLALSSGFWPEPQTHVEIVRYPAGSDAISLLAVRKAGEGSPTTRFLQLLALWFLRPRESLSLALPFGWARRSTILLGMQTVDARARLSVRRFLGWARLSCGLEPGAKPPPLELPIVSKVLRRFCEKTGSIAHEAVGASLLGISTTAHILGGAAMGLNPRQGATDAQARLFGYDDLWVIDGSLVPANLGVNPSLTITALAEHAMSFIPAKGAIFSSSASGPSSRPPAIPGR